MKEKISQFCPKCGSKLVEVISPNEADFWTNPWWSYGYGVNRAGPMYDTNTGKRLHRIELHCPTMETTGFFCRKTESHYILLGETNLSD